MKTNSNDSVIGENVNSSLTKREYFAGLAMQNMATVNASGNPITISILAKAACEYADALIEELNKKK